MPMPTFHINISGSVVAAYAAVLSTITGAAQLANFLRDRPKIKISVRRNMKIVGDPRYTGMTLTTVTVVNAGRRPVTITNVGALNLHPLDAFVITDCTPPLPHELTEGKHLIAMVNQSGIDFSVIESWETYDAVGHTYRLPVAPWHTRVLSRAKRRWEWRRGAAKAGRSSGAAPKA